MKGGRSSGGDTLVKLVRGIWFLSNFCHGESRLNRLVTLTGGMERIPP